MDNSFGQVICYNGIVDKVLKCTYAYGLYLYLHIFVSVYFSIKGKQIFHTSWAANKSSHSHLIFYLWIE